MLILHEVLGWPASEVAELLGQTLPSVKSALYRARATLAKHRPTLQPESMSAQVSDAELSDLLERYMQAWEAADVDALAALLRDDCTFSMPPTPSWYRGRATIAGLVARTIFSGQAAGRWRLLPTMANAQPGFGLYRLDVTCGRYTAYGIQAVTVTAAQIGDITTFRTPALVEYFGLPAEI